MNLGASHSKQSIERQGNRTGPVDLPYTYRVFGLSLQSQIPFEELAGDSITHSGEPDIRLFQGAIAERLPKAHTRLPFMQFSATSAQVNAQGMARYKVSEGREITFDVEEASDQPKPHSPGDLNAHLLGSALGIILHQRACLPLHVSVNRSPAGLIAFTGPSGAGKSTTAAWLQHAHKWPLLSDDVAAVKVDPPRFSISFGPPRIKLWIDALGKMGINADDLKRDTAREKKFHLTSKRPQSAEDPEGLAALIVLSRTENNSRPTLERLEGVDAFRVAMSAVYRPRIGNLIRGQHAIASDIAALINAIKVFRFNRSWDLNRLDQDLSPVIDRFGDHE
jgi:hypothetical protein